jgi:hypothetical protein
MEWPITKDLYFKDAGVNDLGYKGTYLVPMQMLGRKIMHDLVVIKNFHDKILRIDSIRQHSLSCLTDRPQRHMHWGILPQRFTIDSKQLQIQPNTSK